MAETTSDNFPILATSFRPRDPTRVLKHGDTFAVFDRNGDMQSNGFGEEGLYHQGTRFLNRLMLLLDDRQPLLLSSTVKRDNLLLLVDLTNPDYVVDEQRALSKDTIHIFRCSFLCNGACYMRFRVRNYGLRRVDCSLTLYFAADFADIFEVRGRHRARRGELLEPVVADDAVRLAYRGLDNEVRTTRLEFSPRPHAVTANRVSFLAKIPPQEERNFFVTAACDVESPVVVHAFDKAMEDLVAESGRARKHDASIRTSNEQFNEWLSRSSADLNILETHTRWGPYPYAGVPWFSTAFGRDGIITALEHLWVNPRMARGVLAYLAASQARDVIAELDAEPGKILHETRDGEMAALGEIPFGKYYGSVDATPLFVVLAGEYFKRTRDRSLIEAIWPQIAAALEWTETYGDPDSDGFVEYVRRTPEGLTVQGWKDSYDSVFHADGRLAEPPVALCEVQGYVYAARRWGAELALMLDKAKAAAELNLKAERLRERFEEAFWCEELGTYVLALDREKRQCRVRSSNAGHCLFSGIAGPERASRVARTLMGIECFSGWGIRTVATTEARYNPMSYHNGSVWPHDNALIAAGLARYGFKDAVLKILTGLFEASLYLDLKRMPELFCGFVRRPGEGPTLYPVACAPQSWAAGSVFMLLQSCLGLAIDATSNQILINRPVLPESLDRVQIKGLRAPKAVVDLQLERHGDDVGATILHRTGDIDIVILK